MERKLEIRVIDCLLENLTIYFEKGGPRRLGLLQCFADCLSKQIRLDLTLDSDE